VQIPNLEILPVEPEQEDQQSIVEFTADAADALKAVNSRYMSQFQSVDI